MTFTFDIVSPKYGTFTVTAPLRFREEIERHTWHVRRNRARAEGRQFEVRTHIYESSCKSRQKILGLHRYVWSLACRPPASQIDHYDGQPLNNSEDNLRAATPGENSRNRRKRSDNTSGAIGISWHKTNRKFQARIQVDGKSLQLGYFDTIDQAIATRDAAASRLHGPFAVLNQTPPSHQETV